jgi:hypothetical protein
MTGSERPFGLQAPLGMCRPLDYWGAGYVLLASMVLLAGWIQGKPGCAAQLGVNVAVSAAALVILFWSRNTTWALPILLRLFYLPIAYWFFYHQIQVLWPVFRAVPLDGGLASIEGWLFGCQPSLAFRTAFPFRWLSEIFCFAYFSYYFFTPIVGLTALLTRGYAAAERIILATSACFFVCYTLFWLFPTVGPHYWFPPFLGPRLYDGYVFNHLLFSFTSSGEIQGGAFPSSHIAVALLLALLARKETPKLFPFLAGIVMFMLPAVVYLKAHYLLDVPGGLATGLAAYWLASHRESKGRLS